MFNVLLLTLAACQPKDDIRPDETTTTQSDSTAPSDDTETGSNTDDSSDTDTATTHTGGDTETPTEPIVGPEFSEVSWSLSSAIPAVVIAEWTTTGFDAGYARFGIGDTQLGEATAEILEDGRRRAVLVGMHPEATGWFQLGEAETVSEEAHTVKTGAGPTWFEGAAIETFAAVDDAFLSLGYFANDGHRYALILDSEARPVWWAGVENQQDALITRVRLSADGQHVYWNSFLIGGGYSTATGFFRASLDGEDVEHISISDAHHDFYLHDDGTLVYPVYEKRTVGDTQVYGDQLRERTPEGIELTLWSGWETHEYIEGTSYEQPEGYWTVINQVEYNPDDDNYWLSSRNLFSILAVPRSTGGLDWQLGGEDSDYDVDSPFREQHGFDIIDGDLLIHDNTGGADGMSRAARYAIDADARTATLEWSYQPDPPFVSSVLGDALQLPSGNVLVIWPVAPEIHEVSPDGEMTKRWRFETGVRLGFGERYEALVR